MYQPIHRRRGFTLLELLIVIAIIMVLAAILYPALGAVRERARQTVCLSNLRQIGTSLHMYAQDYDGIWPTSQFVTLLPEPPGFATIYWNEVLRPYVRNRQVFYCPNDENKFERDSSYGWSYPHMPYRWPFTEGETIESGSVSLGSANLDLKFKCPSDVMILTDTIRRWPALFVFWQYAYCPINERGSHQPGMSRRGVSPFANLADWHSTGSNVLFIDGHTRWLNREQLLSQSPENRRRWGHDN